MRALGLLEKDATYGGELSPAELLPESLNAPAKDDTQKSFNAL